MSSRSVNDLTPYMKEKCLLLQQKTKEVGISIVITSTARYYKEQVALYAQNRQPLEEVNRLRQIAGLYPISAAENKYKVTWTLLSKHIINLDDNDLSNNKARAFDFAILKEGGKEINWSLKCNVNKNEIPDYEEVGLIAESIGLVSGMRFKDKNGKPKPDYPHCQQPENIV